MGQIKVTKALLEGLYIIEPAVHGDMSDIDYKKANVIRKSGRKVALKYLRTSIEN